MRAGSRLAAPRRRSPISTPPSARDVARALKTLLLEIRRAVVAAVPLRPRLPSGAHGWPATSRSARALRVLSRVSHARSPEVSSPAASWAPASSPPIPCPKPRRCELQQIEVTRLVSTKTRAPSCDLFGRDPEVFGAGAGAGQSDWRAHRLQRRLRAADDDSVVHADRARAPRRQSRARVEREHRRRAVAGPGRRRAGLVQPRRGSAPRLLDRLRPGGDGGDEDSGDSTCRTGSTSASTRTFRSGAGCRRAPRCSWRWCEACARRSRSTSTTSTWPTSRIAPKPRWSARRSGSWTRRSAASAARATRCSSTPFDIGDRADPHPARARSRRHRLGHSSRACERRVRHPPA